MPNHQELVSIVMPAYNAARYLAMAVESVRAQTYQHWELLIVNDASKDNTAEIAQAFQQKDIRIKFFQQERNQGVAKARNLALDHARGKYIAFLDSDDLWLPEKLDIQVAFMQARGSLIAYSGYRRMDEHGAILGTVTPPSSVDYPALLKSNVIGNLTGIYDAAQLGKQFFTELKHEDYVAWLALIKKAGLAEGLPEVLAQYRVYAGSTSSNKLRTLGWQWRIYRQAEKLSLLKSCGLMCSYAFYAIAKRL